MLLLVELVICYDIQVSCLKMCQPQKCTFNLESIKQRIQEEDVQDCIY